MNNGDGRGRIVRSRCRGADNLTRCDGNSSLTVPSLTFPTDPFTFPYVGLRLNVTGIGRPGYGWHSGGCLIVTGSSSFQPDSRNYFRPAARRFDRRFRSDFPHHNNRESRLRSQRRRCVTDIFSVILFFGNSTFDGCGPSRGDLFRVTKRDRQIIKPSLNEALIFSRLHDPSDEDHPGGIRNGVSLNRGGERARTDRNEL